MTERGYAARQRGECYGPNAKTQPFREPKTITTLTLFDGTSQFSCAFLDQQNRTCDIVKKPCLFQPERTIFTEQKEQNPIITYETHAGTLIYDSELREVVSSPLLEEGHDPIRLRPLLASMLESLLRAEGKVLTREQIYLARPDNNGFVPDNLKVIDIQAGLLRKALGQKQEGDGIIVTLRGTGYGMSRPPHTRTSR